MPAVAEERVLVVPTSRFHSLGHFQGFSTDMDKYLPALLQGDDLTYRPRGQMEQDPNFKQLIPYVLFQYTDAAGIVQLFQYTRGGGQGEQRLHAKRSVGVGGHISAEDAGELTSREDIYRVGMRRELAEEIIINTPYKERCVGLINDDLTPVGKVHLGVVHLCEVARPDVQPREPDILHARFLPVGDLLQKLDEFETWSQIVLTALFS
jgi:predicted NUDIX family phosphoesterase